MKSTPEKTTVVAGGNEPPQVQDAALIEAAQTRRLQLFAWVTMIAMGAMAILQTVTAVIFILGFFHPDPATAGPFDTQTEGAAWNMLISGSVAFLLFIAGSFGMLIAGLGILNRQSWGRRIAMVIMKIHLAIAVMFLFGGLLTLLVAGDGPDFAVAITFLLTSVSYILHGAWGLKILRIARCQTYFEL